MSTTATDPEPRMVTFKMSQADHAELEMLAKVSERTVSAELRLAVKAYLADQRQVAA